MNQLTICSKLCLNQYRDCPRCCTAQRITSQDPVDRNMTWHRTYSVQPLADCRNTQQDRSRLICHVRVGIKGYIGDRKRCAWAPISRTQRALFSESAHRSSSILRSSVPSGKWLELKVASSP